MTEKFIGIQKVKKLCNGLMKKFMILSYTTCNKLFSRSTLLNMANKYEHIMLSML